MTATQTRNPAGGDPPPGSAGTRSARPPGRSRRLVRLLRWQSSRVLMLLGLLVLSGAAIGLVVAVPLSFIEFEEGSAQRLDQQALVGQVEVADALVTGSDLPRGWEAGDPALGSLGMLGSEICGVDLPVPNPLSETMSAVWTNSTDDSYLISQAVRVDRWQTARDYVSEFGDALDDCDEFFRPTLAGRVNFEIREAPGTPPITDYVAAEFVSRDPQSVQGWSVMSVGDLVIAIFHSGPTRPAPGFLNEVEQNLLTRIDPADFAPGGVATTTTEAPATLPADGEGSVPGGGAADESNTGVAPETPTTGP